MKRILALLLALVMAFGLFACGVMPLEPEYIDTDGENSRGAKRIVYSNDGLIYYTEDHYESFILLYGEE